MVSLPNHSRQKGFLLFEILVGIGILGITMTAMMAALTEGATSFAKLKTRLVAVKLLQERLESLDARLDITELPAPIGTGTGSFSGSYEKMDPLPALDENECGRLTNLGSPPPIQYVDVGDKVAVLQGPFPSPLDQFFFVERVCLMKPTTGTQQTKLVLYKVRVEVYWPVAETTDYDPNPPFQFNFLNPFTWKLEANKSKKDVVSASTIIMRALP